MKRRKKSTQVKIRLHYLQEFSRFTRIRNMPMKTILFLIVSEIINHGAEYENNHLDAAGKITYPQLNWNCLLRNQ